MDARHAGIQLQAHGHAGNSLTYAKNLVTASMDGLPSMPSHPSIRQPARGTFAATFLLAVVAALEMEGVRLADL